jgi:UDP-N-acetyl-D-mannosaminuronic acid transferase (WecB/TagA/CpsF family)
MPSAPPEFRTILGIPFFLGSVDEAVERMQRSGGLLAVPAAPALLELASNPSYRDALLHADLVLPDSAFMVLVWNLLQRDHTRRLSGLTYLRRLLLHPSVRRAGNCLWVMPSAESATRNLAWLAGQGIEVPAACVYVAPLYASVPSDAALVELLERLRPQHVLLTVGGGVQEQLGWYLKQRLSFAPSIHCVGAAIAFLSGVQARIPVWADRLYLGWLLRSLSNPGRFIPRYWAARKLLILLVRYRDRTPLPMIEVIETID